MTLWKRPLRYLLPAGLLLLTLMRVLAAPGDLDTTFGGGDGYIADTFGTLSHGANALARQSDGKILVAGDNQEDLVLARYTADGTPDTTFGGGMGYTLLDVGNDDFASDVLLLPNEQIIIVGGSEDNFALIARFNTDGTLDATFGTGGVTTVDIGGVFTALSQVARLADGSLIAAGSAFVGGQYEFLLARFTAGGVLDTSFDTDGYVLTDFAGAWDFAGPLLLLPDERVLLAGRTQTGNDFALARFNPDGSLDTSFDGDGKVTTDLGGYDSISALVAYSDDRFYAVGINDADGVVARYNADGTLDTTFSGDGLVTYPNPTAQVHLIDAALTASDKLVVVGRLIADGTFEESLLVGSLLTTDGSFDTSFGGGDGYVVTTYGGTYNSLVDVLIQPDTQIVVSGNAEIGSDSTFYVARYAGDGIGSVVELLGNGGFEDSLTDWQVKGIGIAQDVPKCNRDLNSDGVADVIIAFAGDCAFRFKGSAVERSTLVQSVTPADFPALTFASGDTLTFSAQVKAGAAVSGRVKVQIIYNDGTPTTALNLPLAPTTGYDEYGGDLMIASADIRKFKVVVKNTGTSGKVYVDAVSLNYVVPAAPVHPLALPANPIPLPPGW